MFFLSPWYSDIIYVLQDLSSPPGMAKNKSRTLKLKAAKFCVMNGALYWKDPGSVLLNCLVEEEVKQVMEEFHKRDCGGHLFWKTTANKILSARYYWPTLFADVYKIVASCHECQIFQGKRKLQPLPLKPIEVSAPFQQWGLDFIGEVHPSSLPQHKWILTTTNYFTKWIEAVPTRQATDSVIISFLENNILSRFGCPNKLITDNAATFKSKRMIDFCHKYQITLGHSTAYYPQGNGLAESSNTSLINIIKKLLEINKKSWHKKLVNALWADRRINQMIHLQQNREEVSQNTFKFQEKIKRIYDRKAKADNFEIGDIALKWDARNEDKGKHGKFENIWKGPYKIAAYRGQNAFLLQELNGEDYPGGAVNGRLLKRYYL
eukprot:PITA_29880